MDSSLILLPRFCQTHNSKCSTDGVISFGDSQYKIQEIYDIVSAFYPTLPMGPSSIISVLCVLDARRLLTTLSQAFSCCSHYME